MWCRLGIPLILAGMDAEGSKIRQDNTFFHLMQLLNVGYNVPKYIMDKKIMLVLLFLPFHFISHLHYI